MRITSRKISKEGIGCEDLSDKRRVSLTTKRRYERIYFKHKVYALSKTEVYPVLTGKAPDEEAALSKRPSAIAPMVVLIERRKDEVIDNHRNENKEQY